MKILAEDDDCKLFAKDPMNNFGKGCECIKKVDACFKQIDGPLPEEGKKFMEKYGDLISMCEGYNGAVTAVLSGFAVLATALL